MLQVCPSLPGLLLWDNMFNLICQSFLSHPWAVCIQTSIREEFANTWVCCWATCWDRGIIWSPVHAAFPHSLSGRAAGFSHVSLFSPPSVIYSLVTFPHLLSSDSPQITAYLHASLQVFLMRKKHFSFKGKESFHCHNCYSRAKQKILSSFRIQEGNSVCAPETFANTFL